MKLNKILLLFAIVFLVLDVPLFAQGSAPNFSSPFQSLYESSVRPVLPYVLVMIAIIGGLVHKSEAIGNNRNYVKFIGFILAWVAGGLILIGAITWGITTLR